MPRGSSRTCFSDVGRAAAFPGRLTLVGAQSCRVRKLNLSDTAGSGRRGGSPTGWKYLLGVDHVDPGVGLLEPACMPRPAPWQAGAHSAGWMTCSHASASAACCRPGVNPLVLFLTHFNSTPPPPPSSLPPSAQDCQVLLAFYDFPPIAVGHITHHTTFATVRLRLKRVFMLAMVLNWRKAALQSLHRLRASITTRSCRGTAVGAGGRTP